MVYNKLHSKFMLGGTAMACMKCGRDTQPGQVFCDTCLEIMEWYPVKPGTAVQLPKRQESSVRKVSKRRGPTPEEQIKGLRRQIRFLSVLLTILMLLVCLMAIPTYRYLMEEHVLPGQNYSTVTHTSTQPPTQTGN